MPPKKPDSSKDKQRRKYFEHRRKSQVNQRLRQSETTPYTGTARDVPQTENGGQGQPLPGTTDKPEKPRRKDNRKGDRHKKPRKGDRHKARKEKGLQQFSVYMDKTLLQRVKRVAKIRGVEFQKVVHESFEQTATEFESRNSVAPVRPEATESTATQVQRILPKARPS